MAAAAAATDSIGCVPSRPTVSAQPNVHQSSPAARPAERRGAISRPSRTVAARAIRLANAETNRLAHGTGPTMAMMTALR